MKSHTVVGLFVDLDGFRSFAKDHGAAAAAALRSRFVTRAVEIVRQSDMTQVRADDHGILFIGDSQQAALRAAFACGEEFAADHPYFPMHTTVRTGEIVETDGQGRPVRLACRIIAAPHPGEERPASAAAGLR